MYVLTNGEVLSAEAALTEVARLSLPVAGAMRVRQLSRAVKGQAEDVRAQLQALAEAHCKKGEDGRLLQVPDANGAMTMPFVDAEHAAAFRADERELLALTWEHTHALRPQDLGSKVEIRPELLIALGPLFEEGE